MLSFIDVMLVLLVPLPQPIMVSKVMQLVLDLIMIVLNPRKYLMVFLFIEEHFWYDLKEYP